MGLNDWDIISNISHFIRGLGLTALHNANIFQCTCNLQQWLFSHSNSVNDHTK